MFQTLRSSFKLSQRKDIQNFDLLKQNPYIKSVHLISFSRLVFWSKTKKEETHQIASNLPAALWFVFFMLSEKWPRCLVRSWKFSSLVSSKPEHSSQEKEPKGRQRQRKQWKWERPAALLTHWDKKESNYKTVGDLKQFVMGLQCSQTPYEEDRGHIKLSKWMSNNNSHVPPSPQLKYNHLISDISIQDPRRSLFSSHIQIHT